MTRNRSTESKSASESEPEPEDASTAAPEPVERTVQIAGNSTFVVSLPKEWALDQGLESGMSMYLYPHADRLVAATAPVANRGRSVTVDADAIAANAVRQRARAAYLAGTDRITVAGADALDDRTRRDLERTIGRLVGMEIAETTAETITATNLLDASDVSLPQTVAQTRQLALELHADAITAVRRGDDDLARRVLDRDDDVDRLFAFVNRGFHRGLEDVHEIDRFGTDRTAAFRDYRTARHLERVADHATEIATVATRQSSPPDDAFADRLETVGSDARRVVELALADELDRAIALRGAVRETVAELDRRQYDRASDDPDAYLYGAVLRSVRRTAELGGDIADVRLESTVDT